MKLKLKVTKASIEETEVQFPIFRRHYAGDEHTYTIYSRLDFINDLSGEPLVSVHSISQTDSGYEFEKSSMILDGREIDYALGRGEFECTAPEFDQVVERAVAFISKFSKI